MEFTERYNINGKMVCIDSKKAFDTVSRKFLFKALQAYGFGRPSCSGSAHFTKIYLVLY